MKITKSFAIGRSVRILKWPALAFAMFFCALLPQAASAGTITIQKDAQPNDAQNFAFYAFGPNSGCCMPFLLDDDAGASGADSQYSGSKTWNLPAGVYSFKEDFANPVPVTGWTLTGIKCTPMDAVTIDMASKSFTAKLSKKGNITCRFYNKKTSVSDGKGTVTLKKVLLPATDPGKFTLELRNGSNQLLANFLNGGNGATMGPVTVPAGSYSVGEAAGIGTSLSNYTSMISGAGCGASGAVTVTAGSNIVCTISNRRIPSGPGKITIIKDAQPNDAQNFAFYAFGPNSACCGPVVLDDDSGAPGVDGQYSNSKTWTLPAGSYSFKEDFANPVPVTGWALSSISCTPAGVATVDMSTKSFTANLTAGASITCTFTNKKTGGGNGGSTGSVTLKKVLIPATDPGKFTLELRNSSGQLLANFLNGGNGATMGPVTVPAGGYTVGEVAGNNTSLSNYTSVITGPGCGANGAINVTAGSSIVCTITNKAKQQACTGYPMTADVYINPPGSPFGPQTVDICSGGHVVFHNANSGANWTIQYVNGPTNFPPVPLPNNAVGSTIAFPTAGAEEYMINGTPPFVVHGHINVH